MDDNFKNLLVEIFVPTTAGDGTGRIGTGYPIAKDRILTARHVLFPEDLNSAVDFEIRWHHLRDSGKPAGQWQAVRRDQIVWPGAPELDAAVIEFTFPEEVAGWRSLSARNHATGMSWESEGLPDVGKRDDQTRVAVPMRGGTYKRADPAKECWLDVTAPPQVATDWQGASGSPVFVLSQIVGIIIEVPPGFSGRLTALPASRLLDEPDFCAAIGNQQADDRHARIKQVLEATRAVSTLAIGALECCVFSEPEQRLWRDPVSPVEELAREMGRYDATLLMHHARKAIRGLKDGYPQDARSIGDLVQRLLPLLYDRTTVAAVREKVGDSNAILIGFPVATRFVAEVVMAGADGREARYRPPQGNQELEGKLSLPLTPNSGFDPKGERRVEDFREHLRRKLAVSKLSTFESAFYRCVRELLPESIRERVSEQDPNVNRMVASTLEDLAENESSRYYYLFQLPNDREERAACLASLEQLKRQFRAVAFLELADNSELMRGEWDDFLPLEHILRVTRE